MKKALITGVVSMSMAALIGSAVPKLPGMKDSGEISILQQLLGESRAMFSDELYFRGDLYFHGGIMDEHDEHRSSEFARKSDWFDRINAVIHPSEHMHLEGKRYKKEVLPWLWAATRVDSRNIKAWTDGAYWLASQLEDPKEALKFINHGIELNPENYELELQKARVLILMNPPPEAPLEVLAKARTKLIKSHPEVDPKSQSFWDMGSIMMLSGDIFEKQEEIERALRTFEDALPYVRNPESVKKRIKELLEVQSEQKRNK